MRREIPGRRSGTLSLPVGGTLPPGPGGALDVAPGVPLGDVVPLVVELLPAAQSDLELDPWPLEVELHRDDGQSPLLDLAEEVVDLLPLEEELADAQRVDDPHVAVRVGRDVHVLDERLVPAEGGEAVRDVDAPLPDRFHLVPLEREPALEGLEDLVLVPRPAVRGDHLHGRVVGLFGLGGHSFCGSFLYAAAPCAGCPATTVNRTFARPVFCSRSLKNRSPSPPGSSTIVKSAGSPGARIPPGSPRTAAPCSVAARNRSRHSASAFFRPLYSSPAARISSHGDRSGTEPRLSVPRANGIFASTKWVTSGAPLPCAALLLGQRTKRAAPARRASISGRGRWTLCTSSTPSRKRPASARYAGIGRPRPRNQETSFPPAG